MTWKSVARGDFKNPYGGFAFGFALLALACLGGPPHSVAVALVWATLAGGLWAAGVWKAHRAGA